LAFGFAAVTPVVLDTCVVLWLAGQQDSLSANARGVLADPTVALHVSAISAWEIAIKSRKGSYVGLCATESGARFVSAYDSNIGAIRQLFSRDRARRRCPRHRAATYCADPCRARGRRATIESGVR
jgi:hypothetical protein